MAGRPPGTSPASALRGALGSPWPQLQRPAVRLIRAALKGRSKEQAAEKLGVGRMTIYDLLRDFPELLGDAEL